LIGYRSLNRLSCALGIELSVESVRKSLQVCSLIDSFQLGNGGVVLPELLHVVEKELIVEGVLFDLGVHVPLLTPMRTDNH
jgi:hypothetical protein